MLHENTKHAREISDKYRKELEALVIEFFETCRDEKREVVRAKYKEFSDKWSAYCISINKIRNWPVLMNGNEFEQATLHAYEKVFHAQGSRAGRSSILRTIRIIENKGIRFYVSRFIRLWLIKFFSGK